MIQAVARPLQSESAYDVGAGAATATASAARAAMFVDAEAAAASVEAAALAASVPEAAGSVCIAANANPPWGFLCLAVVDVAVVVDVKLTVPLVLI
jgi:hypothetical protein